jgi:hypothetical protein
MAWWINIMEPCNVEVQDCCHIDREFGSTCKLVDWSGHCHCVSSVFEYRGKAFVRTQNSREKLFDILDKFFYSVKRRWSSFTSMVKTIDDDRYAVQKNPMKCFCPNDNINTVATLKTCSHCRLAAIRKSSINFYLHRSCIRAVSSLEATTQTVYRLSQLPVG